jgi:hypothetical protein
LNKPQYIIRSASGEGNIHHGSHFVFESDYNSGMLKEIERGTIALSDVHKVYPGSAELHQRMDFIKGTTGNIIQWNYPCEDAKRELQRFGCETDNERSVIHRIKKEETEKHEKNCGKTIPPTDFHAPDEQQEEQDGKRQKKPFRYFRRDLLVICDFVLRDHHFTCKLI